MIQGIFTYLPLADVQNIKAQCEACLLDNFTAHQSYTIAGRTITRANIAQVANLLAEASYAIQYLTVGVRRMSVPDFSSGHRGCR